MMTNKNKIEDIIDEIEEFIEGCKSSGFSGNKIIVNRDELQGLLDELKASTPEELKRIQRVLNNRDAILADAKAQADAIIADAHVQTNELVSEHQIMQQAYAQANEVVMIATKNAQEMLDKATDDANNIRMGAIAYTDSLLQAIQGVISNSMETTQARTESYLATMQTYLNEVVTNRQQLSPQSIVEETVQSDVPHDSKKEASAPAEDTTKTDEIDVTSAIDIPEQFFNKD